MILVVLIAIYIKTSTFSHCSPSSIFLVNLQLIRADEYGVESDLELECGA